MRTRRFLVLFTISFLMSAIIVGCGKPKTFDGSVYIRSQVAAERAPALRGERPGALTAAARRRNVLAWNKALWVHAYEDALEAIFEAAHPAPAPVSTHRCTGLVSYVIQSRFGWASDWAQSIVWRESRCDPTASNRSGSRGLFQLLGHDDLLQLACIEDSPSLSWRDAGCNTGAAWELFLEAGPSPWRM